MLQSSWEEGLDVDDGNEGEIACTPYDGNLDTELTDSHCSGMDPLGGNFSKDLWMVKIIRLRIFISMRIKAL